MNNIDNDQLQEEVIQHWEDFGVIYSEDQDNSFDNQSHVETFILPDCQEILSNPMSCILELGFTSISQYVRSKRKTDGYKNYLEYLKRNNINAPQFVKDWAKVAFKERDAK